MSREDISYALRNFTDGDERPVFWGYFPAYDWVAFVWLFGGLEELPFHFPQLCLDIKQWAIELGDPELLRGDQRHVLRGFRPRDRQLRRDFQAPRALSDQRRLQGVVVVRKSLGSGIHEAKGIIVFAIRGALKYV